MYFRFEGADINNQIVGIWDKLMGLFEVKELYDERYATLMEEKGIAPSITFPPHEPAKA